MPMHVKWDGLDELKEWLRELPEHLSDDAHGIVMSTVQTAYQDIYNAYPEKTGNLRAGLHINSLTGDASAFGGRFLGAGAILYNNAPHAWMYENGTQARQTALHATGTMPAKHVFIPRAIRHRRVMWARLRALVERNGLRVTGHAA